MHGIRLRQQYPHQIKSRREGTEVSHTTNKSCRKENGCDMRNKRDTRRALWVQVSSQDLTQQAMVNT